jgi:hypothetical protein
VGPSWPWSYGSWVYNYLCNRCLSPLKLWVRIPLRWGVCDTTICDKVCQWHAADRWFSPGTLVSSTNKNDRHDITEILLKVALTTITLILVNLVYLYMQNITLYISLADWLLFNVKWDVFHLYLGQEQQAYNR